jgi:hypothetical protein
MPGQTKEQLTRPHATGISLQALYRNADIADGAIYDQLIGELLQQHQPSASFDLQYPHYQPMTIPLQEKPGTIF